MSSELEKNDMVTNQGRSGLRWLRGITYQYGYKLVVGQIPRMVYGNDAGFRENFDARRELDRLRALTSRPVQPPEPRAGLLQREGYLVLGPIYDPIMVHRIRDQFEALIADPQVSKAIGPRLKDAARGIHEPVKRIPEIRQLLTPELQQLLCDYYGTEIQVKHVRSWRNVHVPAQYAKQDVYSNLWHNDHDPVTMLRLFVYLSDNVTKETGALRFHSIPTTKKIMRLGYLRRRAVLPPARRVLEDQTRVMYLEGALGSACLINPQLCLHGAGVPKFGTHRDIIQFTIIPSHRPLSPHWADDLPPDPDALK